MAARGTKRAAAKKSTRKAARTPKKAARKPAAKSAGPTPVKTGGGPSPRDVAQAVAGLARQGKLDQVEALWLAPAIESVEGVGASMAWRGKKAVLKKYRDWEADHEVHSMDVGGPWVGATGFALQYKVDLTQKSTGQRHQMEEIAVYTVKNGKIVREEFHFRI
jgi:hypothetical protein